MNNIQIWSYDLFKKITLLLTFLVLLIAVIIYGKQLLEYFYLKNYGVLVQGTITSTHIKKFRHSNWADRIEYYSNYTFSYDLESYTWSNEVSKDEFYSTSSWKVVNIFYDVNSKKYVIENYNRSENLFTFVGLLLILILIWFSFMLS
jgi:hypothetical protein